MKHLRTPALTLAFVVVLLTARAATAVPLVSWSQEAAGLGDILTESYPWLFIGTGAPNDSVSPEGTFNKGVGDTVDISNFEIGAMKSPAPANQTGFDYGPDLVFESSVPNVPGVSIDAGPMGIIGVLPYGQIITYDGNVAITHIDDAEGTGDKNGRFSVSNMGVFAKTVSEGGKMPDGLPVGIVAAGGAHANTSNGGVIQNNSNSMFNDPLAPNPIGSATPTGFPSGPKRARARERHHRRLRLLRFAGSTRCGAVWQRILWRRLESPRSGTGFRAARNQQQRRLHKRTERQCDKTCPRGAGKSRATTWTIPRTCT